MAYELNEGVSTPFSWLGFSLHTLWLKPTEQKGVKTPSAHS